MSGVIERCQAPRFTYTFRAYRPDGSLRWEEVFENLVTTGGKNDLLDKYLAGAAYTAAFYMGLIDAAGFTAVAAGDTSASHAGWTESTAYTQANRPAMAFNAAGGGSKATSAALVFSINATVTIKGAFTITNNTKGGGTGVLYSAGTFSADRALFNGDTLNVSFTASA